MNIYWAAGLFDGEGCVTTLFPKRKQVRLEINMVHKPTLELFSKIVGGKVVRSYSKSTHSIKRKTQWRWRVVDTEAVRVAKLLAPICSEKARQLNYLILFKESPKEMANFNKLIKEEKTIEFFE